MNNDDFENALQQRATSTPRNEGWERDVVEKLAFAALGEQRARRRWGIFFKLAFLAVIAFAIALAFDLDNASMEAAGAHTALIKIDGAIEAGRSEEHTSEL